MEKRIVAVFSAAVLLLFGSVWRIASLAQSSDLAAAAVQQSTYLLQIYHSRGMIYDRNGQPLVNQTFRTVAAVDPSAEGMLALRPYCSDEEEWQSRLVQRRPFLLTVDERAQDSVETDVPTPTSTHIAMSSSALPIPATVLFFRYFRTP